MVSKSSFKSSVIYSMTSSLPHVELIHDLPILVYYILCCSYIIYYYIHQQDDGYYCIDSVVVILNDDDVIVSDDVSGESSGSGDDDRDVHVLIPIPTDTMIKLVLEPDLLDSNTHYTATLIFYPQTIISTRFCKYVEISIWWNIKCKIIIL